MQPNHKGGTQSIDIDPLSPALDLSQQLKAIRDMEMKERFHKRKETYWQSIRRQQAFARSKTHGTKTPKGTAPQPSFGEARTAVIKARQIKP